MTICICGSGVVGQATGRGLLAKGFTVLFVDVDGEKVERLRADGLQAFTPAELAVSSHHADVTMLSVSTPTKDGRINLDSLVTATRDLGARLASVPGYHLVVVRSTVPPGTTEELIIPTIETASGKRAGRDFGVCMNPEYLREHAAETDFLNPWAIVIGEYDAQSGDRLRALYAEFDCPVYHVSLREAEMQKYVHNLFNAVKITYFNEMRSLCRKLSLDADRIFPLVAKSAEGMWSPQYGILDLGPYDGSCLPKDIVAFLAWARDRHLDVSLLETTVQINDTLRAQRVAAREPRGATAHMAPVSVTAPRKEVSQR